MRYAGRDATDAFEAAHPPSILEKHLPRDRHLGDLNATSAQTLQSARESKKKTEDELRVEREQTAKPPLSRILDLQEMEVSYESVLSIEGKSNMHKCQNVARRVLPKKVLAFYSAGADDEISMYSCR